MEQLEKNIERYENKVAYIRNKIEYHSKHNNTSKVKFNQKRLTSFELFLTKLLNRKFTIAV